MFLLARFIREQGIKVVLSGEGADEAFLGYDIFKETLLREAWSSLSQEQRRARIRRLYPYLPHFSEANISAVEAVFARSCASHTGPLFSHAMRLDNAGLALRLLRAGEDGLGGLRSAIQEVLEFESLSTLKKAQWIEFHTLLQGYLLSSQGDRMMFAHGVEPRNPFLSPAVVAYAASLPQEFLLSPAGDEKFVLKQAFRASLPREILEKPKQPYRAPDAQSFFAAGQGRFADWVEYLLDERRLRALHPVDPAAAMRLIAKIRRTPRGGVSPREDQAFVLLLSLSVLDRQFIRREGISRIGKRPPLARAIDLT
jgi:asparagine synthase (glutamine-hydrolysing)